MKQNLMARHACSSADAKLPSDPPAQRYHLFDVHIGVPPARGRRGVSAAVHCCEVCQGMEGCIRWYLLKSGEQGALATCSLYGTPSVHSSAPSVAATDASRSKKSAALLFRTDVEKLRMLTRCHVERIANLQSQLAGAASLELLVDASALQGSRARAATQLRKHLGVPAFLYTVEEIWQAFPAVVHWPSPETHDSSRNRLKGDVVKTWWQSRGSLSRPRL